MDRIAILDFGGQYTQLIARRIRELGVYSEILACTHPVDAVLAAGYRGLVLSGGPSSVYEPGAPLPDRRLLEAGVPVLGICYGMQAMGYLLGGEVVPAERREYGAAEATLLAGGGLLDGVLPERWLIAEWPDDQPEPVTYWLSSLPATTSPADLVRYAKIRWRIEHDYRELKTGLGLDHFEGRSWQGWHRHVTLVTAAHLFLTLLRGDPKAAAPA